MYNCLPRAIVAFCASMIFIIVLFHASFAAKPNIIWIMADDLGYGDVGYNGQKQIKTPCIDSLAKQGVRYSTCYSGSTVCAPSRGCLLTGLHTGHAYIRGNSEVVPEGQNPLAESEITVAEILKNAGYTTAIIGKWGLGMNNTVGEPSRQGFDYYYSVLCQRQAHDHYLGNIYENGKLVSPRPNVWQDDLYKDKALQFITDNKNKPFFLYLALCSPHANNQVPDINPYKNTTWPAVEKIFAAMVTRLDSNVGAVVKHISQLGLDSNTIIFFTSDNGPHSEDGHSSTYFNSNGDFRGMKRDLWDGGIHVPMVVRWTGKTQAGRTSDFQWAFWDFLPTAADLAGVAAPSGLDGFSILPDLLGKEQPAHPYLYWEFLEGTNPKQAIRTDSLKVVRNWPTLQPAVYNIMKDIGETTDLAASRPQDLRDLTKIMSIARFPSSKYPRAELDNLSTQDLVARYPFENSGADSAFGLFPARFQGSPYFTFGHQGKGGLYVDGKSGNGIVQQNVGNNMTISFWLKTPTSGGASWSSAAGLIDGNSPAANGRIGIGLTGGKVTAAIGTQVISSTGAVSDGQWHHIAVTRNGSNGQTLIYMDGTQTGSGTGPTGSLTQSKALTVGTTFSTSAMVIGAFDDLSFYNYVLTPGAIQTLASALQGAIEINLVQTRIQAESYTRMNSIRMEATADADSGLQIGGIAAGSWAEYRISVPAAGWHALKVRVSNPASDGTLAVFSDNTQIATFQLSARAGWQDATAVVNNLPAGLQTLKFTATAGTNISLNWIDIAKGSFALSSNLKNNHGSSTIKLAGNTKNKEVLFTVAKSGPVTISLFTSSGRLAARWHSYGNAGTLNRTAYPMRASLPGGVTMLALDQEGKRVATERIVVFN